MTNVPQIFGSMVFNDKVMQERLPKTTYKALKKTVENGRLLGLDVEKDIELPLRAEVAAMTAGA